MATSDAEKPPVYRPGADGVELSAVESVNGALSADGGETDVIEAEVMQAPQPSVSLHYAFLGIAVVVVVAALLLTVRDGEKVVLPFTDTPLPGTCTFRELTGKPCPGCGLTRAFISMGHGQIREAWNYNPAGFFFFAVVAFQIPYRIYQIARIRRGRGEHRFARFDTWILLALVFCLLTQWLVRLFTGGA